MSPFLLQVKNMNWDSLASLTLSHLGSPIVFSRNGTEIITLNGIYRNAQELKKSKSKTLRLIDCDVVTVPYSDLIKSGDEVNTGVSIHRVAGNPKRDGSGGMIVKLESADIAKSEKSKYLR